MLNALVYIKDVDYGSHRFDQTNNMHYSILWHPQFFNTKRSKKILLNICIKFLLSDSILLVGKIVNSVQLIFLLKENFFTIEIRDKLAGGNN